MRSAATILGRSLRGLTLRLVDPNLTHGPDAAAALAAAIPLMLEQGLPSSVTEVGSEASGCHLQVVHLNPRKSHNRKWMVMTRVSNESLII